ncbi:hypothetical protein KKH23_04440 [Patescibacteria group bacterium]|nr:hypothetical protein [Patescibacteria group bacterium]
MEKPSDSKKNMTIRVDKEAYRILQYKLPWGIKTSIFDAFIDHVVEVVTASEESRDAFIRAVALRKLNVKEFVQYEEQGD